MTEQTISERIEAVLEALRASQMVAYNDGTGGHLFRHATDEEQAAHVTAALLAAGIMQEVRAEALREAADAFEPEVVRAAKWASETSDSFREAMSRKWAWGEAIKRLRDRADSIVRARRDGCGDRG